MAGKRRYMGLGCGDPLCDGCRLVRGLYAAQDGRTESPARVRRRHLAAERSARNRGGRFVDAEPYRLLLRAVAHHLHLDPSKIARYPSLGLRPGLLAGIANGSVKRISRDTAESLRQLVALLPAEREVEAS